MAEKPRKDPNDRPPRPETRLSLRPLSVEKAAEAMLQIPPMPKGWKPDQDEDEDEAPPKKRRKAKPLPEDR